MKRTIVISAVVIASWIGGTVGAALLLPAVPPLPLQRPLLRIVVGAALSQPELTVRPATIENRVLAAALILSQA